LRGMGNGLRVHSLVSLHSCLSQFVSVCARCWYVRYYIPCHEYSSSSGVRVLAVLYIAWGLIVSRCISRLFLSGVSPGVCGMSICRLFLSGVYRRSISPLFLSGLSHCSLSQVYQLAASQQVCLIALRPRCISMCVSKSISISHTHTHTHQRGASICDAGGRGQSHAMPTPYISESPR